MAQIRLLSDVFGNDAETTIDREQRQGSGSPEGVIEGRVGDIYRDITTPAIYVKQTGDNTTTGWGEAGGGGGVQASISDDNVSVVCDGTADTIVMSGSVAGESITLDDNNGDITVAAPGDVNVSGDTATLDGDTTASVLLNGGHGLVLAVSSITISGADTTIGSASGEVISIADATGTLKFFGGTGTAQGTAIADATTAVDIIPLFNTLLAYLRLRGDIDT